MIKSFADKELEKLFRRKHSRTPEKLHTRVRQILAVMSGATRLDDLASIPGGYLEPLKGKRRHQHSIRVSGNWRLCFEWKDGDIYGLELIDYH
ncbi:MAG: type II toxin-antitoxin system RelE/ParE family toxin [Thermodesulfobacteriota bacterium]